MMRASLLAPFLSPLSPYQPKPEFILSGAQLTARQLQPGASAMALCKPGAALDTGR